jgi:hypothetical protein
MDFERLLTLALEGDKAVLNDIKAEAKRRCSPYMHLVYGLLKEIGDENIDYNYKSSFSNILEKNVETLKGLSNEEYEVLRLIASKIPYYKRSSPLKKDNMYNDSIFRLCTYFKIDSVVCMHNVQRLNSVHGKYLEKNLAYKISETVSDNKEIYKFIRSVKDNTRFLDIPTNLANLIYYPNVYKNKRVSWDVLYNLKYLKLSGLNFGNGKINPLIEAAPHLEFLDVNAFELKQDSLPETMNLKVLKISNSVGLNNINLPYTEHMQIDKLILSDPISAADFNSFKKLLYILFNSKYSIHKVHYGISNYFYGKKGKINVKWYTIDTSTDSIDDIYRDLERISKKLMLKESNADKS